MKVKTNLKAGQLAAVTITQTNTNENTTTQTNTVSL
jgi:hypothetical protein